MQTMQVTSSAMCALTTLAFLGDAAWLALSTWRGLTGVRRATVRLATANLPGRGMAVILGQLADFRTGTGFAGHATMVLSTRGAAGPAIVYFERRSGASDKASDIDSRQRPTQRDVPGH
jgi:hypothetical protein